MLTIFRSFGKYSRLNFNNNYEHKFDFLVYNITLACSDINLLIITSILIGITT